MKKFEEPVFDMVKLNSQDTITTSGGGEIGVIVPPMTSGDVDGCGAGACGLNDVIFE